MPATGDRRAGCSPSKPIDIAVGKTPTSITIDMFPDDGAWARVYKSRSSGRRHYSIGDVTRKERSITTFQRTIKNITRKERKQEKYESFSIQEDEATAHDKEKYRNDLLQCIDGGDYVFVFSPIQFPLGLWRVLLAARASTGSDRDVTSSTAAARQ